MNVLLLSDHNIHDDHAIIHHGAQLNHIHTTLKATVGDTLKVGRLGGMMGTATITHLDAHQCVLGNLSLNQAPPDKLDMTVILALPRPKVLRRLVLDMTAFGVNHIILINSARTDKSYWHSPMLDRLDEFVLEGLQQGMDTKAPTITLAKRFKPFVQDEMPSFIKDGLALVFHPYADVSFDDWLGVHERPKVVIIGAEGGFVPYEIELLAGVGVNAVSLGRRILRTESAISAVLGRWL